MKAYKARLLLEHRDFELISMTGELETFKDMFDIVTYKDANVWAATVKADDVFEAMTKSARIFSEELGSKKSPTAEIGVKINVDKVSLDNTLARLGEVQEKLLAVKELYQWLDDHKERGVD